jgi:hypothetical protein
MGGSDAAAHVLLQLQLGRTVLDGHLAACRSPCAELCHDTIKISANPLYGDVAAAGLFKTARLSWRTNPALLNLTSPPPDAVGRSLRALPGSTERGIDRHILWLALRTRPPQPLEEGKGSRGLHASIPSLYSHRGCTRRRCAGLSPPAHA